MKVVPKLLGRIQVHTARNFPTQGQAKVMLLSQGDNIVSARPAGHACMCEMFYNSFRAPMLMTCPAQGQTTGAGMIIPWDLVWRACALARTGNPLIRRGSATQEALYAHAVHDHQSTMPWMLRVLTALTLDGCAYPCKR